MFNHLVECKQMFDGKKYNLCFIAILENIYICINEFVMLKRIITV